MLSSAGRSKAKPHACICPKNFSNTLRRDSAGYLAGTKQLSLYGGFPFMGSWLTESKAHQVNLEAWIAESAAVWMTARHVIHKISKVHYPCYHHPQTKIYKPALPGYELDANTGWKFILIKFWAITLLKVYRITDLSLIDYLSYRVWMDKTAFPELQVPETKSAQANLVVLGGSKFAFDYRQCYESSSEVKLSELILWWRRSYDSYLL